MNVMKIKTIFGEEVATANIKTYDNNGEVYYPYLISKSGRLFSTRFNKIKELSVRTRGDDAHCAYTDITINVKEVPFGKSVCKHYLIHRLVAMAFLPVEHTSKAINKMVHNSEGNLICLNYMIMGIKYDYFEMYDKMYNAGFKYQIDHIDGDKRNNHISNLRWVTRQENAQHHADSVKNVSDVELTKDTYVNIKEDAVEEVKHATLNDFTKVYAVNNALSFMNEPSIPYEQFKKNLNNFINKRNEAEVDGNEPWTNKTIDEEYDDWGPDNDLLFSEEVGCRGKKRSVVRQMLVKIQTVVTNFLDSVKKYRS